MDNSASPLDPSEHALQPDKSLDEQLSIAFKIRDEMAETHTAGRPPSVFKREKRRWRSLTPELREIVGDVIVASGWVEESATTLLQNHQGNWMTRVRDYGESGKALVSALRRVEIPESLLSRLDEAMEKRNFIAHGFLLIGFGGTELLALKPRRKPEHSKADPPEREKWALTVNELKALADELWDIQDELKARADQLRKEARKGDI